MSRAKIQDPHYWLMDTEYKEIQSLAYEYVNIAMIRSTTCYIALICRMLRIYRDVFGEHNTISDDMLLVPIPK